MRLGPRIVPVQKELDVASIASGATAYYVAENATIPASEETFALTALLRPRELAALVPISNRLLRTAAANAGMRMAVTHDRGPVDREAPEDVPEVMEAERPKLGARGRILVPPPERGAVEMVARDPREDEVVVRREASLYEIHNEGYDDDEDSRIQEEPWPPAVSCEEQIDLRRRAAIIYPGQ